MLLLVCSESELLNQFQIEARHQEGFRHVQIRQGGSEAPAIDTSCTIRKIFLMVDSQLPGSGAAPTCDGRQTVLRGASTAAVGVSAAGVLPQRQLQLLPRGDVRGLEL